MVKVKRKGTKITTVIKWIHQVFCNRHLTLEAPFGFRGPCPRRHQIQSFDTFTETRCLKHALVTSKEFIPKQENIQSFSGQHEIHFTRGIAWNLIKSRPLGFLNSDNAKIRSDQVCLELDHVYPALRTE